MKQPRQTLRVLHSYTQQAVTDRTLSASGLAAYQRRKIRQHLNFVWNHSPFYQQTVPHKHRLSLRHYPIMDKTQMMNHLSKLNTKQLDRDALMEFALHAEQRRKFNLLYNKKYAVGLSSGTSGHRGLFIASQKESAEWAGRMLHKVLPSPIWRPVKIALFLRANSPLYEESQKQKLSFHFFDLFHPFQDNVDRLIKLSPDVLVAPGSVLHLITQELDKRGASLQLQKVIAAAEVLPPDTEKDLTRFFHQPIHQIYQATEGFLGTTCPHGTLHLNEDMIHIEKEYLKNRSDTYTPIITDFRRTTQPIIRYRLNDLLVEQTKPCPCGSPLAAVKKIIGRQDDLIHLPTANGTSITIFPDLLCRLIICNSENVRDYKIIFSDVGFEIQLSPSTPENNRRVANAVTDYLRSLGAPPPPIRFTLFKPRQPGEKRRRVINTSS